MLRFPPRFHPGANPLSLDPVGLIVVAAGTGQRLGAPVHKALVDLDGRSLVEHCVERLLRSEVIGPCVVVGHADDLEQLRALLAPIADRAQRRLEVIPGGARRQDSVAAGLAALPAGCERVFVHDAARPFVPLEALPALAEAVAPGGAALLAVPLADTVKQTAEDPRQVSATLDRSRLHAAQTPQAFRTQELAELLAAAAASSTTVTDEAALYEGSGRPVQLVPGSRLNFKLTTAEDLALVRALLQLDTGHPSS